jgi:hypothetical protein
VTQDLHLEASRDDLRKRRDALQAEADKLNKQQRSLFIKERDLLDRAQHLNRAAEAIDAVLEGEPFIATGGAGSVAPKFEVGAFGAKVLAALESMPPEEWAAPMDIGKQIGATSSQVSSVLVRMARRGVCQRNKVNQRRSLYRLVRDRELPIGVAETEAEPEAKPEPTEPDPVPAAAPPPKPEPKTEPQKPKAAKPPKKPAPRRPRRAPRNGTADLKAMEEELLRRALDSLRKGQWYTVPGVVDAMRATGLIAQGENYNGSRTRVLQTLLIDAKRTETREDDGRFEVKKLY